jgi:hypothetical protein
MIDASQGIPNVRSTFMRRELVTQYEKINLFESTITDESRLIWEECIEFSSHLQQILHCGPYILHTIPECDNLYYWTFSREI